MVSVKKEVDSGQLEVLRKVIFEKLSAISGKKFEDKSVDDFSLAFRIFLLKYLRLNYEFTEEELVTELDKKKVPKSLKERIVQLISLVSEINYRGKKITKDDFQKIIDEGTDIIKRATGDAASEEHEAQQEEKPGKFKMFIKNLLGVKALPMPKMAGIENGHKEKQKEADSEKKKEAANEDKQKEKKYTKEKEGSTKKSHELNLEELQEDIEEKKKENNEILWRHRQELLKASLQRELRRHKNESKAKEDEIVWQHKEDLIRLNLERELQMKGSGIDSEERIVHEKEKEAKKKERHEVVSRIKSSIAGMANSIGSKISEYSGKTKKALIKNEHETKEIETAIIAQKIESMPRIAQQQNNENPNPTHEIKEKYSSNHAMSHKAIMNAHHAMENKDTASARKFYNHARRLYIGLRHHEKKNIYGHLMNLYEKLAKMEREIYNK